MDTSVYRYLLDKVFEDARSGSESLNSSRCEALSTFPTIDKLRDQVTKEDFDGIRSLYDSGEPAKQTLGIALLRGIDHEDEVREYLDNLWDDTASSFDARIDLTFDLAQIEALDEKRRRQVLELILGNWEEWKEKERNWFGGAEKVLSGCRERLKSDSTPDSKRWLYLCAVAAADDRDATMRLLNNFAAESPDPFLSEVAEKVIDKMQDE